MPSWAAPWRAASSMLTESSKSELTARSTALLGGRGVEGVMLRPASVRPTLASAA
jgi:hypothetical protein